MQDSSNRFGVWFALAAATVGYRVRLGRVLLEEEIPPLTELDNIVFWHSDDFHEVRQLFGFIFTRENWLTGI